MNLGRSVSLFYKVKRDEIQAVHEKVFTEKGQAKFLPDGTRQISIAPTPITSSQDKAVSDQARVNSVPTTK